MIKENFLIKILKKLGKKLGIIKEYEIDKSMMCERAINSHVCPENCKICAWNNFN